MSAAKGTKKKSNKKSKKVKGAQHDEIEFDSNPAGDSWARDANGDLVTDTARGHSMIDAFRKLFKHLREDGVKGHLKDSYGLWLDVNGSDDEDEDEAVDEVGMVKFDAQLASSQQSTKKIKHAIKFGNPEFMAIEELQSELKSRNLSAHGDKDKLIERLDEALEDEAQTMRETTRVVNHFTSKDTVLNIQTMVAKMNKQRHEDIQEKLLSAHHAIKDLNKLHDVISDQEAIIAEDERLYAEALARIAELERLNALKSAAVDQQERQQYEESLPQMVHKATFLGGNGWEPWSLEDLATARVDQTYCEVMVIDTSGIDWTAEMRDAKASDGRPIRVHHSAWQ
jgi:hypothetical protein